MFHDVSQFISYFDSIRRRTLQYVQVVPAARLDWSPQAGEFTCGDIIRHLIAAEHMFVGVVVDSHWRYPGHTDDGVNSLEGLIAQLETSHVTAVERLRTLSAADLEQRRSSLDGPPIRVWRLLMAMVEHEIHHRSQLAMYLMLLGVTPPHIYGMGVEEVIARATG